MLINLPSEEQTPSGGSLYGLRHPPPRRVTALLTSFVSLGAAQRFPDKVDKDPEGARALNIAASKLLASVTAARDIFMIYISTDYVFPGRPGDAPYEADATPGPTNLYGQTKLDGENAVLEEYAKAGKEGLGVVLRVPVLYGHAETPSESAVNVLMDSVWKAQTEGTKITMDHWALRYPTNTEDIGRICHGKCLSDLIFFRLCFARAPQFCPLRQFSHLRISNKFVAVLILGYVDANWAVPIYRCGGQVS